MSTYEKFIQILREKKYPENTKLEKHRIVPGHQGGSYAPKNVILVSHQDHAEAHRVRWETFQNKADLIAFLFLSGQVEQATKIRHEYLQTQAKSAWYNRQIQSLNGRKAQVTHCKQKTGFYDTTRQQQRGKKGAAKNRLQKTGAFDPKNLEKARLVQKQKKIK